MALPVSSAFSAYANAAKNIGATPDLGSVSSSSKATGGQSFSQMLQDLAGSSLNQTRSAEGISANAIQGKSNIGDVVAAVSNAEVTLQTVMSIRDRVVNGIQEIMRMPVWFLNLIYL